MKRKPLSLYPGAPAPGFIGASASSEGQASPENMSIDLGSIASKALFLSPHTKLAYEGTTGLADAASRKVFAGDYAAVENSKQSTRELNDWIENVQPSLIQETQRRNAVAAIRKNRSENGFEFLETVAGGREAASMTPQERAQAIAENTMLSAKQRQAAVMRSQQEVGSVYQPRIKAARRTYRDWVASKQRAMTDTTQAFQEAGQEIAKIGGQLNKINRASQRSSNRQARSPVGPARREGQISAGEQRAHTRADRSYSSRLRASLPAEMAIAQAGMREAFDTNITSARSAVGEIRGEKDSAVNQARNMYMDQMRTRNRKMYMQTSGLGTGKQNQAAAQLVKQLPGYTDLAGGSRKKAAVILMNEAQQAGIPRSVIAKLLLKQRRSGLEQGLFQQYGQSKQEGAASQAKEQADLEGKLWDNTETKLDVAKKSKESTTK